MPLYDKINLNYPGIYLVRINHLYLSFVVSNLGEREIGRTLVRAN
jgi:hypothetical protein